MAVKLNKANDMLSNLRHFLNEKNCLLCNVWVSFTLCFSYWVKNSNSVKKTSFTRENIPQDKVFLWTEIPTHVLYLKTLNFWSHLIRQLLKTGFF